MINNKKIFLKKINEIKVIRIINEEFGSLDPK